MNIEAVLLGLLSVAHTPEQAERAARTILHDHAHQLAEQIREQRCDPNVDVCACCEKAADLIDPEVQR
jgi:hypothetical protein